MFLVFLNAVELRQYVFGLSKCSYELRQYVFVLSKCSRVKTIGFWSF